MVNFLFSVHTITEATQSNRQGGARAVDLPSRSIDLVCPGVAPLLLAKKNCPTQKLHGLFATAKLFV